MNNIYDTILSHVKKPPVDLDALLKELGLKLQRKNLRDDISGKIERNSNDDYTITVNSKHSCSRQRFTIAHELGHFVLHRALFGDGLTDNAAYRSNTNEITGSSNITAAHETEANKFAALVLMPKEAIKSMKEEGIPEGEMARRLKVSLQAMKIRLGTMSF